MEKSYEGGSNMKKKQRQFLAMLLVLAMLVTTVGGTGVGETFVRAAELEETKEESNKNAETETEEDLRTMETAAKELKEQAQLENWSDAKAFLEKFLGLNPESDELNVWFEGKEKEELSEADGQALCEKLWANRAFSEEEADSLNLTGGEANLLIMAEKAAVTGAEAKHISVAGGGKVKLKETKATSMGVFGGVRTELSGTSLEKLTLFSGEEPEDAFLRLSQDTEVPEIQVDGGKEVTIEGNASLGVIRVTKAPEKLTVRATASVKNESQEALTLVKPDGSEITLKAGQQEELVLTSYLVTFMAEDEVLETSLVKPGDPVEYPEELPEKEGKIFTSWYQDEEFTEPASQFEAVNGQLTFYARYIKAEDAVTVTFETAGGDPLKPLAFAKGETLLTKPVSEITTRKEGYTFGGWCRDAECTESFSYTEPLEENVTLYAFFTSDEPEISEKDGSSVDRKDFGWQEEVLLTAEEGMTLEDVEAAIRLEAGSGDLEPTVSVRETADGFALSGTCYEKDGEKGFEPGSTVSVIVSDGVHFAGYSEDVETMVLYVYKEEVEIVDFSDEISYELWDQVTSYTPVVSHDDENQEEGLDEEIDQRDYDPGEIVFQTDREYKKDDIVVFYDGEIGREEQNIEAYTEGSFDGYVLFAEVLTAEKKEDGTHLTFGYADPEAYLSDLDVHVTEDVDVDEELSEEDLELLSSKISSQVEENEELKAQMLVAVMSSRETQKLLDEMYGEGVYALAGMNATLQPQRPTVKLSVSGSTVTANITVSAKATIKKDGKILMTVTPKLAFTQSLSVQTNVNGGKIWLDMSVTLRSTSKIALTISATTGKSASVFEKAAESMKEIVKPEGIKETDDYDAYDQSVQDLMDVMQSVVSTSLSYNDLFTVRLLTLKFSFYGIITLGVDLDFVGQIGILATFGVEIVITNGERIGFKYNFLKFKGSSYTQKLESNVTTNIYLIGKIGVRLGLRLTISITLCGIARASVTGSLYAYAELSGMYFFTANLLSGANTSVGALNFEVGIDVSVDLGLRVKLIFKTIKKNWNVYKGRWPLWSTSVSSKLSYMNVEKLDQMWESSIVNADKKTVFGFQNIPMKTWTLMTGKCLENELLWSNKEVSLKIENLTVNGEKVPSGDPKNKLFSVGDPSKRQNQGMIYMDESIAAEYVCEKAELDVVLTYQNSNASAMVKKQVRRFHLSKQCAISTTTQKVQVKLYDWCAHAWGLEAAAWDNAVVYETSFEASHMVGGLSEPTATGKMNLNTAASAAIKAYPEIQGMNFSWLDPSGSSSMQYSVPRISNFCYMTPDNGVVRFDVFKETKEYEVTYYLYVRRFEGDGSINYHVKLTNPLPDTEYAFSVYPPQSETALDFVPEEDGSWKLSAKRSAFNGEKQPLLMTVDGAEPVKTGFFLTGREQETDVRYEITLGDPKLEVELGEGIRSMNFEDGSIVTETGIRPGTEVRLKIALEEGYTGVEVQCEDPDIQFRTEEDNTVVFSMPTYDLKLRLRSYKYRTLTFLYNYGSYGTYKTVSVREDGKTEEPPAPFVDGLTFRGWKEKEDGSGDSFVFGGNLVTDQILYADWTCDVTVDFGAVKGQALYLDGEETRQVFEGDGEEYYRFTYSTRRVGEKVLDILVPDYPGYEFTGWYTNAEAEGEPADTENLTLTGGLILYAGWIKLIPVTFERNDPAENPEEGSYANTVVQEGALLTELPENPVRDHYEFTGWYKDREGKEAFDPATETISEELTLYAGWKAVTYSITYEMNGVEKPAENPESYTTENTIILKNPEREGYEFTGWTGTGLTEAVKTVEIPAGSSGDRQYTAHWKTITYKLSYNLVRGTLAEPNPESYTVESDEITLKNPALEKYEFTGWIGTGLTEPTMEVKIPNGSIGDRNYQATWKTDDPSEKIVDMALEAVGNGYESRIEALPELGEEAGLDERVLEAVREALQTGLNQDERISAYLNAISVTVVQEKEPEMEDRFYRYLYRVTVTYKDDAGKEYVRENTAYEAWIFKNQPEVTLAPTTGSLTYGQSLKDSTLTGGCVKYGEVEVPGTFSWQDETIIPWGGDNGSVIYWVIFTPDEEAAKLYAPCEIEVSVQTQIGVNVEFTADSRDYVKDSTEATGTYRLVDADRGIVYEELQLTGGQMEFSQSVPGKELQVVFAGYQLENDEDGLYILLNESAKSEAEIRWIQPVLETSPTVNGTVTGGTALRDVEVTGGRAAYKVAANAYQEAAGTWTWDTPGHTLSGEGEQEFTLTFVPEDEDGFRRITGIKVKLTVTKREVEIPLIAGLTYDGSLQKPVVNETADYEVTENNGGISAGTYTVTLRLKYPEYMVWKESGLATDGSQATVSSEDPAVAVVSYQIRKADLTVSADPAGNGIQVQKLGYGQEMTEGEKETRTVNGKVVDFRLSAQDMISGVVVSYERNGSSIPVTGKWKWMLTDETGEPYNSQPMQVGTWQIEAEFIPEENQRGNLNPVSYRFQVEVERAVPDASSCAFETINVIGLDALNVPLTLCKPDQPLPVNPNNGETVNGVWNWEDPEMILNSRSYNVTFTPTDSKNYETVNSSAEVKAVAVQPLTVYVHYGSDEAIAATARTAVSIWGTNRKRSILVGVSEQENMTFSEVKILMGNETAICRVDASGNYVYTNSGFMTVIYHSSLKIVEIVMERALTAEPTIDVYMTQTTGTQSLEADETKTAAASTTSGKRKKARRKPKKTAESESETAAAETEKETEAVTEKQTEAPEPSTEEVTEPTTEPVTEKTTEAGTEAPEPEKQTETPATEATTEAAEPATESQTVAPEPAPEPSTEPQTEKQTETAAPEPSTEPQTEAAAEPQTEAILPEPATEPMTEAPEPATEVQTELASELQSESLQTEAMNTEGAEMPLPEEG